MSLSITPIDPSISRPCILSEAAKPITINMHNKDCNCQPSVTSIQNHSLHEGITKAPDLGGCLKTHSSRWSNTVLNIMSNADNIDTEVLMVKEGTNIQGVNPNDPSKISDSSKSSLLCANCATNITPLWRRDEAGATICNACGLYFKLHGVHRPISMKKSVIKRRKRVSNTISRANVRCNGNTNSLNRRTKHSNFPEVPQETSKYDFARLFTFKHQVSIVDSDQVSRNELVQDVVASKSQDTSNSLTLGEKCIPSFYVDTYSEKCRRVSNSQTDTRPWLTSPLPEHIQPSPVFSSYSLSSSTHVSSNRDSLSMSPHGLNEEGSILMPLTISSESATRHLPTLPPISIITGYNMQAAINKQNNHKNVGLLPSISEFDSYMLRGDHFTTDSFHHHNVNSVAEIHHEMSPQKLILEHSSNLLYDSNTKSLSLAPTKLEACHLYGGHGQSIAIWSDPILHSLASKPLSHQENNLGSACMLAPVQKLL